MATGKQKLSPRGQLQKDFPKATLSYDLEKDSNKGLYDKSVLKILVTR